MKYRTDLNKMFTYIGEKSAKAVADMIRVHTKQEVRQEGMIVVYNKRITKLQEQFIRGYAAGLLQASYDEP